MECYAIHDFGCVWIELIFVETENWNWKHCSEIIFKCVNSAMRPIFNKKVVEKCNLWDSWMVHGCIVTCQQLWAEPKKKKCRTQNANTKLIWIQIFKKKKKKSMSIIKKKFIRLKKASAHSIPMGLISKTQAPKQSSYSTISQQLPVNHNRKSVEPQWNPTAYILLTQKKIILTHLPSNAFNTSRTQ